MRTNGTTWPYASEAPSRKHRERVFTYRGKPVAATTTKAWYSAVKRAGVEPLRFHDLRHTFASWHVQQGTPLSVLQELGGWQSSAMVSRYAHLGAEHLAPWNDRLATYGTKSVTRTGSGKRNSAAQMTQPVAGEKEFR